MKIEWNKVTWYSIALATILYLGVFCLAFCLGQKYEAMKVAVNRTLDLTITQNTQTPESDIINSVIFDCKNNKTIHAIFFKEKVELTLSDGRNMLLPQAISASGARYANTDESFVFWNKGDTAFVQEGNATTFEDCVINPAK
jgi:membrane-bound inhibitor of C-type lysozyme